MNTFNAIWREQLKNSDASKCLIPAWDEHDVAKDIMMMMCGWKELFRINCGQRSCGIQMEKGESNVPLYWSKGMQLDYIPFASTECPFRKTCLAKHLQIVMPPLNTLQTSVSAYQRLSLNAKMIAIYKQRIRCRWWFSCYITNESRWLTCGANLELLIRLLSKLDDYFDRWSYWWSNWWGTEEWYWASK